MESFNRGSRAGRVSARGVALIAGVALAVGLLAGAERAFFFSGKLELDVRSDYSHIRVRRQGNIRSLIFVRDNGEEAYESQIDLQRPYELRFDYTKYMFASYLFRPRQQRVLIVGLGGGAMVHFLKRHEPELRVDALEIDPVVVRIADQFFGVRSDERVRILTADAFAYFKQAQQKYDVIYMDAFLKPSNETDATGVPLRLRTLNFYREIQQNLAPGGLVVFNVNSHPKVAEDLRTIQSSFRQAYVFTLPERNGYVVVGDMAGERRAPRELVNEAARADRRFRTNFSFQRMVRSLNSP